MTITGASPDARPDAAAAASEAAVDSLAPVRDRAEAMAHLGIWRVDLGTQVASWSSELYRVLGRDPAWALPPGSDALELAVHPGDRAAVSDALATALRGERGSATCRLVRPDGTVAWLSLGAEREIDAHGRVVALVGFVQPAASIAEPVATSVDEPSPATRARRVGSGVALLVEDEDTVRRVLGRMLSNMGYAVFEASTGDEALELIGSDEDGIDLVVTDIRMPGIQGTELARRIRAVLRDVPVLYVSGYAVDLGAEAGAGARTALLEKPFDAEGLRASIVALLGGEG